MRRERRQLVLEEQLAEAEFHARQSAEYAARAGGSTWTFHVDEALAQAEGFRAKVRALKLELEKLEDEV